MTTSELNEYILHYLKNDKTHTAIMLTGEWGSGKTYYVENDLVPFLKNNKSTAVVVSLYGLDDVSMISKSIYMELRMSTLGRKHSEALTTGKVIAKIVLKNIIGSSGINVDISKESLTELYESVDLSDKLLILEDVERSKININSLMGYVNGLVEDGVKILLVANEDEILKKRERKSNAKFVNAGHERKSYNQENIIPEDVKQYLLIKEKTIGDTIQFYGNFEQAIKDIIKDFDNNTLDKLFQSNQDLYKNISELVRDRCGNNLRTFIFAMQKMIDIINRLDTNKYDDDFFECLLLGIICFSSKIKADEFPKWNGSDYLSVSLGSIDMPLMRIAYDYIRWQTFDETIVKKIYEAYRNFRFFEKYAEYKDSDLRVLINYFQETEEHVLLALNNIENKLNSPNIIGIHAYCKLAYYMLIVGSVLGFDYKKSFELMIDNAKGIKQQVDISADIYFSREYNFDNDTLREVYNDFLQEITEAISLENKQQVLLYNPDNIESLYNDICKNTANYTIKNRFLSRYDQVRVVEMLMEATSKQIDDFRGILFAVYRYAVKGQFDEKDINSMKNLLILLEGKCKSDNPWDKIQQMQINMLKSNLTQFIKQMT